MLKRLGRNETLSLSLALLILTVITFLSWREWRQFRRASSGIPQTRQVIQNTEDLVSALKDAETGQRGFLLTSDTAYLEPWRNATATIPSLIDSVDRLTPAIEDERIRRLKTLVDEKLAEIQATIDLRRDQDLEAALAVVRTGRGRMLMDQIRQLGSEIIADEYAGLQERAARSERLARDTQVLSVGGGVLLFLLLLVAMRKIDSGIVRREELISDLQGSRQQTESIRDLLQTTLSSIGDAVMATDRDGRITFLNPVAQELTGWDQTSAAGRPLSEIFQIINEATRQPVESPVTKVLREGQVVGLANHTVLLSRSGKEIPIDDSGAPIRDPAAQIMGVVLTFRDITERRRTEAAAHRLAAIVDSSDDAIIGKDLNGVIHSWNAAAERLYGYTAEEIAGQSMTRLLPPDRPDEETEILRQLRAGQRVDHFETVRLRKDGARIDVSLTISPIRSPAGEITGVSHIARDITERKRFEEQLRETAKLESLGVLAGGVAHDFNNLLVGILGNASLALEKLPPGSTARPAIDEVLQASERAAHLTRQMLAYSGKGRFIIEPIDLSEAVREIVSLVQTSIHRTVQLRLELASNLPLIDADIGQLQQLLMNLVINGAEACGSTGGIVKVTTGLQTVDDEFIRNTQLRGDLSPGRYVSLEVRDTGNGMDEDTQQRMFDPFFTTKFTGRGLGLAAVSGIVRGHGGAIQVRSAPGEGSTFRVLLPPSSSAVRGPEAPELRDLGGKGTILVVDDEEIVRRTAKMSLERYGYTVLLAENGLAALDVFRAMPEQILAVLLDMTMPVMSGEETLEALKSVRPDVPVILSSGFNELEAVQRFQGRGLAGFLQKPYTAARLAGKVKVVAHTAC